MNIGFIGLGNMGSGMANNLLKYCQVENDNLLVMDLNQNIVDQFVANGAVAGISVKNIAQQCDIIFTSLPSSIQVNQVAFGDEGILKNTQTAATWFETSTNEISEWEKIRSAAPSALSLIDAPVTGGAEGAAAGTLTMLLGAEENPTQKFESILASFTSKALYMGPPCAGYVTKLGQLHLNYLVAQGIGEVLTLGAKANLDLNTLYKVLQHSCAQSYVVDHYIPKVLDGSYDPSFALGLATKDMRLISELGKHLKIDLTLADQVYETYKVAAEKYGAEVPHLSVIKLIEEASDTVLRS